MSYFIKVKKLFFFEKKAVQFLAAFFLILSTLFVVYKVGSSSFSYDMSRYKSIMLWAILFFTASYLLKRKNKEFFLLYIPILFIVLANAMQGLFGYLIFFGMSYVIGSWFDDKFRIISYQISSIEKKIFYYFIGHLVLTEIFLLLIHLPVNFLFVYTGIAFLVFFLGRGRLYTFRSELFGESIRLSWLNIMLIFFSTVFLVFYLLPVYVFEDINAYLYIPRLIVENGIFHPDVSFVSTLSVVGAYPLYTINYMFGGENAIRILLFSHLTGSIFLLSYFLKRHTTSSASFVGVLSLVSVPIMYFSAAGLFNDTLDLFMGVSFFVLFFEAKSYLKENFSTWILGFFILMSFAFPIRNQVFVILFPISCALLYFSIRELFRHRKADQIKGFFIGVFLFVLFSLPWLLRNYIIAKNPFFPMFNKVFKSPFFYNNWDVQTDSLGFIPPLSPKLIYDMTFHFDLKYLYNRFHQFGFGFTFFVFSIVAIPSFFDKKFRNNYLVIFFLCIFSFICYHLLFIQARYLYSALPLYCFFIAALYMFVESYSKKIAVCCVSVILGMNFFFQQQGMEVVTYPFPIMYTLFKPHLHPEVQRWDGIKEFFNVANVFVRKDEKILMHYSQGNYFSKFQPQALDWYFYPVESKIHEVSKATNNDPYKMYDAIFRDLGFDGLILTYDNFYGMQDAGLIEKVYTHAGHTLYRPNQNFKFDVLEKFNVQEHGINMLRSGWHASEPSGTWSSDEASLEIKMPRYKGQSIHIAISLFPLTLQNAEKKVKVVIQGKETIHVLNKLTTLQFDIDGIENSGSIQVKFICPEATSPSALGVDINDKRILGIHLQNIKVSLGQNIQ